MTDPAQPEPPVHAGHEALGRRVLAGAGWMVVWRMVARAAGLLSTLVLARILVPADFGLVALAASFAAGFEALSEIGVQDALVRARERDRGLYDTAFALQLGRAVVTGLLLAAAAPLAGTWFGEPRLTPILLVLAGVALAAGFENVGIIEFRRELRYRSQFFLLALPRLVSLLAVIVLALVTRSYWALVAGSVIMRLGQLGLGYMLHPYRPFPALSRWRDLLGFSLWSWAAALANAVWMRADPVVLGATLGAGEIGLFMLACEVALLPVSELVEPAADALFAGAAAAEHAGQDSGRLVASVVATLLCVLLPVALAISAAGHQVAAVVLGPRWEGAGGVIAIGVWGSICAPLSYVSNAVLVARGWLAQKFFALLVASTLRVAAVAAAARTADLRIVAAVLVGVMVVEAGLFALPLVRRGGIGFADESSGIGRLAGATAASAAALGLSGLGWRAAPTAPLVALAEGAAAGVAGIVGFTLALLLLWLAAGRPDGLERRAVRLVRTALGR